MTYREIVYMCRDICMMFSDDASFENEHFIFLLDKFRAHLISKYYESQRKEIPSYLYQILEINLAPVDNSDICGVDSYLKSIETIPNIITYANTRVTTYDNFSGIVNFVPAERFNYVGNGRFFGNMIYATIAPDNHLYVKAKKGLYIRKVYLIAMLEDPTKAIKFENCEAECNGDILDMEFKIEASMVPELIELTVREVVSGLYRGGDLRNNGMDDLNNVAQFIRQAMKDRYAKDYMNGQGE